MINTPIPSPCRAPASPLFLLPSLLMHIHLYDYLNGCQKNTVTRLNWAVREERGEMGGGAVILHTPFYRAGKWWVREKAVAMATCWQLLSLCLESTGCSLATQRLGWGEVRWEGSSCQRGTRQGLCAIKPKGCWLRKRATKE